jgi:hypothetical protein
MSTIRVTGPGLNNWFAEQLVKDHGPQGARELCSGPMLAAVEAVIAEQEARTASQAATDAEKGQNNG